MPFAVLSFFHILNVTASGFELEMLLPFIHPKTLTNLDSQGETKHPYLAPQLLFLESPSANDAEEFILNWVGCEYYPKGHSKKSLEWAADWL